MRTLEDTVNKIMTRLEDINGVVWGRSEIEGYVQNSYDNFVRDARCIWDVTYIAEDVTYCGNHNYKWEEDYMATEPGVLTLGLFNFTGGTGTSNPPLWEQQYANNGIGPCNHTNLWEDSYTTNDFFSATAQLPPLTLEVDRVTFDNYRIEPQYSKDLADHYKFYEYIQGPQRGYTLDKDGYFTIRKVPVPSAKGDTFTFTGTYGTLRSFSASEFGTSPTITGTGYGVMRSVPLHHPTGTTNYGTPRRVYRDTKNFRVEYFRRGLPLSDNPFEVPDRYCHYIELWAMYLARERDGVGQNKALANHYLSRYNTGLDRLKRRVQSVNKERVNRMGGGNTANGWPELAQYGAHYPKVPR